MHKLHAFERCYVHKLHAFERIVSFKKLMMKGEMSFQGQSCNMYNNYFGPKQNLT
jgi:hypothetical protein